MAGIITVSGHPSHPVRFRLQVPDLVIGIRLVLRRVRVDCLREAIQVVVLVLGDLAQRVRYGQEVPDFIVRAGGCEVVRRIVVLPHRGHPTAHIVQILSFPPVLRKDRSDPVRVIVGDRHGRRVPRICDGRWSSEEVVSVGGGEAGRRITGDGSARDLIAEVVAEGLPRHERLEVVTTNDPGRPSERIEVGLLVESFLAPGEDRGDVRGSEGEAEHLHFVDRSRKEQRTRVRIDSVARADPEVVRGADVPRGGVDRRAGRVDHPVDVQLANRRHALEARDNEGDEMPGSVVDRMARHDLVVGRPTLIVERSPQVSGLRDELVASDVAGSSFGHDFIVGRCRRRLDPG